MLAKNFFIKNYYRGYIEMVNMMNSLVKLDFRYNCKNKNTRRKIKLLINAERSHKGQNRVSVCEKISIVRI